MSSIVTLATSGSSFEATIVGADLEVVGLQGEENIIEVKGDSPITIAGGALQDTIKAGVGDATIVGGDGDDLIIGGEGDDVLIGGEGDDEIFGGPGADIILGGAGQDIINSGMPGMDSQSNPMGDTLKGGMGEDVFEFVADEFSSGAVDEILDFKADGMADIINIMGVGDDSTVSYDAETGMVTIDGDSAIDIGTGMDVTVSKNDDTDTWELF